MEKDREQNAIDFEMAMKQLINEHMVKGLTITEAVGTLHLCTADITNQIFNPQITNTNALN